MRGVRTNGERIVAIRQLKGITQEQLAIAANVDVTTLRKMEKGTRSVDLNSVKVVAEVLGAEIRELVAPTDYQLAESSKNIEVVKRWHQAYVDGEIDLLLSLHSTDTLLQIPGAEGLPAAGNFRGINALRAHLIEVFSLFKVRFVSADNFDLHAIDNLVFLRTTASIEYLPTGKCYTARHVNEFEFRDGLIARRTTIADYGQLRQAIE